MLVDSVNEQCSGLIYITNVSIDAEGFIYPLL